MTVNWRTRLAAAAGAAVLLAGTAIVPASAESATPFAAGRCNYWNPPTGAAYDRSTGEPLTQAWQITRLAPEKAWTIATGRGVTVGVVDTGVDNIDMRYFAAPRVSTFDLAGTDRTSSGDALDCTHGTKVVSLLASRRSTSSEANFSGLAPDVTVRAYRALQLSEVKDGRLEPLGPTIAAIRQAIADRVDVLNISQSAPSDDPQYRAAIEDALAAGIVVVAAAGNGGGTAGPSYPAAYPGVIAVGMSDQTDAAVAESQYDKAMPVSVAAPGKNLMALLPSRTSPGLAYDTGDVTGTSFATPLVTGVVAMILQRYPKLTPAQVKHRLEASADPPAGGTPDKQLGYGIVNPYRALTLTISDESATPVTATPVAPPLPEDQRPQPDLTVRNTALVVAAIAVAGTLLGVVVRFALPAARRRGFRPATPDPRRPSGKDA